MPIPKILVLAGSIRTGSFNARLAALAAKEIARAEAEVTRISLLDFPLPLYDGDHEARAGPPENAVSPEYNASLAPLLKNTIDWISRVRENKEPPLAAYRNRVFALGAASNGTYGGMRSIMAMRHVLELGCGALVIPEQIAVREASHAFDENDELKDERSAGLLRTLARRLVELARLIG